MKTVYTPVIDSYFQVTESKWENLITKFYQENLSVRSLIYKAFLIDSFFFYTIKYLTLAESNLRKELQEWKK